MNKQQKWAVAKTIDGAEKFIRWLVKSGLDIDDIDVNIKKTIDTDSFNEWKNERVAIMKKSNISDDTIESYIKDKTPEFFKQQLHNRARYILELDKDKRLAAMQKIAEGNKNYLEKLRNEVYQQYKRGK